MQFIFTTGARGKFCTEIFYIHRTAKETQHFLFLKISVVNIFYLPNCI